MKAVIFGNSGSGKSTLARSLAEARNCSHLDLDSVAWKADEPGAREELEISKAAIEAFVEKRSSWVIEGCYSSLLEEAMKDANLVLFLNPGIQVCQENCRSRPWEPHKYDSKEAQDKNLAMLLDWVADYETREDEFSLSAHRAVYERFAGEKYELTSNRETRDKVRELGEFRRR